MPRVRKDAERAAGKLVSAIQKEWGSTLGQPAEVSLDVMEMALQLMSASKHGRLEDELGGRTVTDYLGALWVRRHPSIKFAIEALERARRVE